MTLEEAKRILYVFRAVILVDASHIEAFEMAIKALEQEPRKDEVILTNKEYRELISNEYDHGYEKGYLEALEQDPNKWIPVSERLPEEDGDYFVTLENGVVEILGYSTTQRTTYPKGFYYISNGFSWRQTINPVIAWMPLPEPYKAESEE